MHERYTPLESYDEPLVPRPSMFGEDGLESMRSAPTRRPMNHSLRAHAFDAPAPTDVEEDLFAGLPSARSSMRTPLTRPMRDWATEHPPLKLEETRNPFRDEMRAQPAFSDRPESSSFDDLLAELDDMEAQSLRKPAARLSVPMARSSWPRHSAHPLDELLD